MSSAGTQLPVSREVTDGAESLDDPVRFDEHDRRDINQREE
jgi:hypothetical protein